MPLQPYSLSSYGEMMADTVRMRGYERALAAACRPGCVVMDLGAGAGIMSLLACQLGARHVYAVDDSEVIFLAREIAQANGLSDRITFLYGRSSDIVLSDAVDVVVSDLHGILPMLGGSLKTLIDARRFLAPGGTLIPTEETLRAALVQHDAHYDALTRPWRRHALGHDASAAERLALQSWQKMREPASAVMLTVPSDLLRIDYMRLSSPSVSGSCATEIAAQGVAHGLCVWFDARLFGDIGFSNEPTAPPTIYGQAFFPLSEPVAVEIGDRVAVRLRVTLVGDVDYVWIWETEITSASGASKARFQQSTFFAPTLGAEFLRSLDAEATPALDAGGEQALFVLSRLNGATTLSSIATSLLGQFPQRFTDRTSALSFVTGIARQYIAKRSTLGAPE